MTGQKTTTLHAGTALLPSGWADDVLIRIGADGRIKEVRANTPPPADTETRAIILPALTNLHSHGFQRAMAGLTERRGAGPADSFWTWRETMYRFLDRMTPEHVGAITAFAQMEMLEAGYAASAEFHYLHHQPGGKPYDTPAELSARIVAAAAETGAGLTLLPVLYCYGGLDKRPLGAGQLRFGNDPEGFGRVLEGAEQAARTLPADCLTGVAPHSLRAVDADMLAEVARLRPDRPIHMHIAEQPAEVEEVRAATGARPVEWLLSNADVTGRWCLIHCTHMSPGETRALAGSGAVAGLCPITESNLGDGIFDGMRFARHGGVFGVGSDSNIRISLAGELRTLEYSQRLKHTGRAMYADADRSAGRVLYEAALQGGAQAAGRDSGAISVGKWADLIALDAGSVHLAHRRGDRLLDSLIFAGGGRMVTDTWAAGRHVVSDGRHRGRARIASAYRRALGCLLAAV